MYHTYSFLSLQSMCRLLTHAICLRPILLPIGAAVEKQQTLCALSYICDDQRIALFTLTGPSVKAGMQSASTC